MSSEEQKSPPKPFAVGLESNNSEDSKSDLKRSFKTGDKVIFKNKKYGSDIHPFCGCKLELDKTYTIKEISPFKEFKLEETNCGVKPSHGSWSENRFEPIALSDKVKQEFKVGDKIISNGKYGYGKHGYCGCTLEKDKVYTIKSISVGYYLEETNCEAKTHGNWSKDRFNKCSPELEKEIEFKNKKWYGYKRTDGTLETNYITDDPKINKKWCDEHNLEFCEVKISSLPDDDDRVYSGYYNLHDRIITVEEVKTEEEDFKNKKWYGYKTGGNLHYYITDDLETNIKYCKDNLSLTACEVRFSGSEKDLFDKNTNGYYYVSNHNLLKEVIEEVNNDDKMSIDSKEEKKYVVCKDNQSSYNKLTLGKKYLVKRESKTDYIVDNDANSEISYRKDRFVDIIKSVICIDNYNIIGYKNSESISSLQLNGEYHVVREDLLNYYIINPKTGVEQAWFKVRFKNKDINDEILKPNIVNDDNKKYVICKNNDYSNIHNGTYVPLTIDKKYEVLQEETNYYHVKNEEGKKVTYLKTRFVDFKEEKKEDDIKSIIEQNSLKFPTTLDKLNLINFNVPQNFSMGVKKQMSNANPFDQIISHVERGLAVAAAAETSDMFLDAIKPLLGEKADAIIATDEGKQLSKIGVTLLITLLMSKTDFLSEDKKQIINNITGYVMEGSARDFIQPRMGMLREMIEKLVTSAVTVGAEAFKATPKVSVPEEFNNASSAAVGIQVNEQVLATVAAGA